VGQLPRQRKGKSLESAEPLSPVRKGHTRRRGANPKIRKREKSSGANVSDKRKGKKREGGVLKSVYWNKGRSGLFREKTT